MAETKKALNVYEKLLNIILKLNVPKNLYNSFGKYSYRSAEGILEAVKPLLKEQNCVLIMEDDIEIKGDSTYIKAIANFIDCDSSERLTTKAYAKECEHKGMSADQCTGTASSYARKYCLNGLFCIDDTKDSDTDEVKNIEENTKSEPVKYFCDECGTEFKTITLNGKKCTPEMQYQMLKKQSGDGRAICKKCREKKGENNV